MSDEARSEADPEADPDEPHAESAGEALGRARLHACRAAAEAAAALEALLDAASLAAGGREARRGGLAPLARLLEALRTGLETQAPSDAAPLLDALQDALDEEIARWEARSREEPEARAVVRAFLAVRELLFELGVHRGRTGPRPGTSAPSRPGVQRVPVEG